MIIGVLEFEIYMREAQSLKDKRGVVKGLKERLRHRFNVSVAETDFQDQPKRAAIAIATVGTDTAFVQSVLDNIRRSLGSIPRAELGRCDVSFFTGEGEPADEVERPFRPGDEPDYSYYQDRDDW